jgi:hypothetical protein
MVNDDVVLEKWCSRTAAGSFLRSMQHRTVGLTPSAQSDVKTEAATNDR